jgi:glutamate dehydrogenase (NAD(P)+)
MVPLVQASLSDRDSQLQGYIVVDSLVAGRAMGGLRMTADVTAAELARLARQMTMKLALAGLPIGGAKGGIVSDLPPGEARDRVLRSFGKIAAPLLNGGIYLGSDQGISYGDRNMMLAAAGYEISQDEKDRTLPCSWAELWSRCYEITGFGIAEATSAVLPAAHSPGPAVVIQGFGTVGRGAAIHLAGRGYRIVAVADRLGMVSRAGGLPVEALLAATDPAGLIDRAALPADVVLAGTAEAWLDVPADILVLAAGGAALRTDNVGRVQATCVVEGANHPCDETALQALADRGITVVPGIVANAGGAIATGLVLTGQAPPANDPDALAVGLHEEVRSRIRAAFDLVGERAAAEKTSLPRAAPLVAAERVAALHGVDGAGQLNDQFDLIT